MTDTDGRSSLVPEDFDLEAAKNAPSTTPSEERPKCPHCETATLQTAPGYRGAETKYMCKKCYRHVAEDGAV